MSPIELGVTSEGSLVDSVVNVFNGSDSDGDGSLAGTIIGSGQTAADLVLNDSLLDLNVTKTTDFVVIYTAAAVFLTFLVIGLIAVNLFVVVLLKGRKIFQEFPFFTIVWQLVIVNDLHMLTQATTVLPLMFIAFDESDPIAFWWNKIGGASIQFTEEAVIYFTLLMTLNRFSIFVLPRLSFLFQGNHLLWSIGVIWILVFSITGARLYLGLTKSFSKDEMGFENVVAASNTIFSTAFNCLSFFVPLIIFSLYVFIWIFIRRKRSQILTSRKNDRSLLKQAAAISLTLEMTKLTTTVIPLIAPHVTAVWLNWILKIFGNSVTIFNQMINSLLFLSHNKTVRGVLYGMFGKEIPPEKSTEISALARNSREMTTENEKDGRTHRLSTRIVEGATRQRAHTSPAIVSVNGD